MQKRFFACVEILQSMCRRAEMDSCNFRNEGIGFFSRTALMILPDSFESLHSDSQISTKQLWCEKTQVRSQEKAFVFSKNLTALFPKRNLSFFINNSQNDTSNIQLNCHPEQREDPALGLCKRLCEILRFTQNDKLYIGQQIYYYIDFSVLVIHQKVLSKNIFRFVQTK